MSASAAGGARIRSVGEIYNDYRRLVRSMSRNRN
jgi:hypothetical protein